MERELDRIARWIADADGVCVLTGAGISTDSGLPDFRGPQGVWTSDPTAERRATIDAWIDEADLRRDAWQFRLATRDLVLEPNAGHRALADLERLDRMDLLVTQNVDGLHQDAGTDPGRIVEVHGTVREVVCLQCGARGPVEAVLDRVEAGDLDPHCEACGGLLKSATISFGQALETEDLDRARLGASDCDVFLALGTSLAVYPVAWLPEVAKQHGAKVVIVNGQPTEKDDVAHEVLIARLGEALPALVDRVEKALR